PDTRRTLRPPYKRHGLAHLATQGSPTVHDATRIDAAGDLVLPAAAAVVLRRGRAGLGSSERPGVAVSPRNLAPRRLPGIRHYPLAPPSCPAGRLRTRRGGESRPDDVGGCLAGWTRRDGGRTRAGAR